MGSAMTCLHHVLRYALGFRSHHGVDGVIWTRPGVGRAIVLYGMTNQGCVGLLPLVFMIGASERPLVLQENHNTNFRTMSTSGVDLFRINQAILEALNTVTPEESEFDVVALSWGSFLFANLMMHFPRARDRIGNVVLVDPVCFLGGA